MEGQDLSGVSKGEEVSFLVWPGRILVVAPLFEHN